MRYTPKHKAPAPSFVGRRTAGVVVVSAATVGAGFVTAGSAHADTSSVWDRVAACESGGNWSINTGNGFYGGLQFTAQTWAGFGGLRYASSAQYASRAQQIIIAQNVLRVQGPGAWPVCSVRAGLTRANGLGGVSTAPVTAAPAPTVSRSASRSLAVDGIVGPMTSRAIQKWVGTTQDGIVGPITKRALQRTVGTTQDGIIGPKTIAALQTKIGISRDGSSYLNARTVIALQRYLNAHVL